MTRVGVFAVAVVFALSACGGSDDAFGVADAPGTGAAEFSYEIPVGAGEQLDAGTPLEILPAELLATVGQSIEIVNLDDRGHLVGPWYVGAGETLRQEFTSPGEFIGICTVHPSGEIKVIVEEA
ncbi:MAG: cupredoxin domain-containing protein [Acidimicrobiales bacterium]